MKSRNVGPHSRPHRLAALDGRTHEGKLFNEFRADLFEHVGPNATMTQRALIDRACWVHLKCCLMDQEIAAGTLSEIDAKMYLAWANTERRILGQLGLDPPPRDTYRGPTLADLRAQAAERERQRAANGAAA